MAMETYTSCSGWEALAVKAANTRRHDRKHIFNDSLINCGFLLECDGTFSAFRLSLLSELSKAAMFDFFPPAAGWHASLRFGELKAAHWHDTN
jgi:hypothetical protein